MARVGRGDAKDNSWAQSYTSGTLTGLFSGGSASLNGTVLTLDSMKGEDADEGSVAAVTASNGFPVLNGAMSNAAPSPGFAATSGGVISSYPSHNIRSVGFTNGMHSYSDSTLTLTPTETSGGGESIRAA